MQWYTYVPGAVKVQVKDWPGARLPELKVPPFAVTVWGDVSPLVQVTVLLTPRTTVTVAGENPVLETFVPASLSMPTETVAGAWPDVVWVVVVEYPAFGSTTR